jgi:hypothetical protein
MFVSLGTFDAPVPHPIVAPSCRLLVDIGAPLLGTMPLAVGSSAAWNFPLPEWLTPTILYFQDWMLDNTGQFTSSRRLSVPVTK